jgi:hypothetical protein
VIEQRARKEVNPEPYVEVAFQRESISTQDTRESRVELWTPVSSHVSLSTLDSEKTLSATEYLQAKGSRWRFSIFGAPPALDEERPSLIQIEQTKPPPRLPKNPTRFYFS